MRYREIRSAMTDVTLSTIAMRFKRTGSALISILALIALVTPVFAQEPAVVEYYHLDAIGSIRAVTDQGGQVVRSYDYFPFGDGSGGTASGTDHLRFASKNRDSESGSDYFGARYYVSRSGRFTTVDPVVDDANSQVDPQRWNRYAYARNSPTRYIDPDGRILFDWNEFKRNVQISAHVGQDGYGVVLPVVAAVAAIGSVAGDLTLVAGEGLQAAKGAVSLVRSEKLYTVYQSLDTAGRATYVGITTNLPRRMAEHMRQVGRAVEAIRGMEGLTLSQARGVEQVLIEYWGLAKNGGTLENKINSIAKTNKAYADMLKMGQRLLEDAGIKLK
jgi:RHS repeat-associated protein